MRFLFLERTKNELQMRGCSWRRLLTRLACTRVHKAAVAAIERGHLAQLRLKHLLVPLDVVQQVRLGVIARMHHAGQLRRNAEVAWSDGGNDMGSQWRREGKNVSLWSDERGRQTTADTGSGRTGRGRAARGEELSNPAQAARNERVAKRAGAELDGERDRHFDAVVAWCTSNRVGLQKNGQCVSDVDRCGGREVSCRGSPSRNGAHTRRTVGLDAIEDCSKVVRRTAERVKYAPHGDKHELLRHGAGCLFGTALARSDSESALRSESMQSVG